MYIKLCIDGMTSVPFSAKSLPVRFEKYNLRDEIVLHSRETYGMPREEIEEKIMKWSTQTYSEKGNRSSMKKEESVEKTEEVKKPKEKEEVEDLKPKGKKRVGKPIKEKDEI